MTEERYRELLTAAPAIGAKEYESIVSAVHRPSRIWLSVRSALRRIAKERREACRNGLS